MLKMEAKAEWFAVIGMRSNVIKSLIIQNFKPNRILFQMWRMICGLEKLVTYRWGFLKRERKWELKLTQKNWRTNRLRMGALLMVISDIHRVHTKQEDPVNVRNDPPARYPSSSCMFFKFSGVNLGSDFNPFWENLFCTLRQWPKHGEEALANTLQILRGLGNPPLSGGKAREQGGIA